MKQRRYVRLISTAYNHLIVDFQKQERFLLLNLHKTQPNDNPTAVEYDKLNVRWGSELVGALDKVDSDTTWEVKTYNLEAKSTETILSFDNLNETVNSFGTRLDGVSINLCQ